MYQKRKNNNNNINNTYVETSILLVEGPTNSAIFLHIASPRPTPLIVEIVYIKYNYKI